MSTFISKKDGDGYDPETWRIIPEPTEHAGRWPILVQESNPKQLLVAEYTCYYADVWTAADYMRELKADRHSNFINWGAWRRYGQQQREARDDAENRASQYLEEKVALKAENERLRSNLLAIPEVNQAKAQSVIVERETLLEENRLGVEVAEGLHRKLMKTEAECERLRAREVGLVAFAYCLHAPEFPIDEKSAEEIIAEFEESEK